MSRSMVGVAALFLAFVALAQGDQPPYTLWNATIIDGTGRPGYLGSVTVSAGQISQISTVQEATSTSGKVMDMSGTWLIPGLIDAHVHLSSEWPQNATEINDILAWAIEGGVTTVRDMGGDAGFISSFAEAATTSRAGAIPEIYYSCLVGGPPFFADFRTVNATHGYPDGDAPWLRSVTSLTDLQKATDLAVDAGVTGVKVYGDVRAGLFEQVVTQAHKRKLRAWSHAAVFPSKPSDALDAGVDVLSHTAYLVWEATQDMPEDYNMRKYGDYPSVPYDSPAIVALLDRFRQEGRILDATVFVFTLDVQNEHQAIMRNWSMNVTRLAMQRGVQVCAGTDDLGYPDESAIPGLPNIHKELELYVTECGFTPLQAIHSATLTGASALGVEGSHGSIETGKQADMVVLRADPSLDILNTREIVSTIKAGVVTDSQRKANYRAAHTVRRAVPRVKIDC